MNHSDIGTIRHSCCFVFFGAPEHLLAVLCRILRRRRLYFYASLHIGVLLDHGPLTAPAF